MRLNRLRLGWALIAAASGCAHQATVRQWQASVQHTISEQSAPDPAVLRSTRLDDGWRVFRINGQVDPEGSTDQVGVLIGRVVVGARPWFVFLLGAVKDHALIKARLAAMTPARSRWQWAMGPDNAAAVKQYRAYWARRWASEHPNRPKDVQPGFVWPRQADHFKMTSHGSRVTVRELNSGAHWSMTLASTTG